MGWVSGIVVFLLTWWLVIFMVLPWGLKRDKDGTPNDPKLKQKVVLTTGISIVLWVVIYVLIDAEIVSFREMAEAMAQ